MKTGEVRRVRLPSLPGHTQGGERPAVLVQNEPFLSALPTVLIVPFTGKLAAGRFPGTVVVKTPPDKASKVKPGGIPLTDSKRARKLGSRECNDAGRP
jgi:mRNA-degrading endonuclease toxin of MazEF toxin-antitoxin module